MFDKPTKVVESFTLPTRYIACPNCGKGEHRVSHLMDGLFQEATAGPWYCRHCLWAFTLKHMGGGMFAVEPCVRAEVETEVTLEIRAEHTPLRLHVRGMRFIDEPNDPVEGEELDEQDRYFYEEHTCPSNVIGVDVSNNSGDDDPHGVWSYVKTEIVRRPDPPQRAEGRA